MLRAVSWGGLSPLDAGCISMVAHQHALTINPWHTTARCLSAGLVAGGAWVLLAPRSTRYWRYTPGGEGAGGGEGGGGAVLILNHIPLI